MNEPTVKHRVEYAAFVVFARVLSLLPEVVATLVGSGLGWLAGSVFRVRRRTVDENLARAFPAWPSSRRRRVARATYRHFCREFVSLIRFSRFSATDFRRRCEVVGLDLLTEPISRGRGVIILLGHFGNWEIGGSGVAAQGVPLAAVAKVQRNRLFDAYVRRVRARFGLDVVLTRDGPRAIMKKLRVPSLVAIVADQNASGGGVFVDFFGVPAATVRGPGVIAARSDAPVVFVEPRRLPGLRARYRVAFRPLPYEPQEDLEATVTSLTQAYMHELEASVRKHPEQYFWFHQRWKTRPTEGVEQEPAGRRPVEGPAPEQVPIDMHSTGESR